MEFDVGFHELAVSGFLDKAMLLLYSDKLVIIVNG